MAALPQSLPLPPLELANRVGCLTDADDPYAFYEDLGRHARQTILSLLPAGWSFEGKRVLDFGCGAGRTLRHFLAEATAGEFWGCDIDEPSIDWIRKSLSPPLHAVTNGESPPLPFEDGSFDLVYAVSVFTHLTTSWSAWLLELHRVIAPGGFLIATFIGEGAAPTITNDPWDEDRIGMNVLKPGQSWDLGGPMVLHSPWWIHAHWGRAFEVVELRTNGFGADAPAGQGVALMAKRDVTLTPAELEEPEPREPRELAAARHNLEQLTQELVELRSAYDDLAAAWRGEQAEHEAASVREAELRAVLAEIERSHSWRITAPPRGAAGALRDRRR